MYETECPDCGAALEVSGTVEFYAAPLNESGYKVTDALYSPGYDEEAACPYCPFRTPLSEMEVDNE